MFEQCAQEKVIPCFNGCEKKDKCLLFTHLETLGIKSADQLDEKSIIDFLSLLDSVLNIPKVFIVDDKGVTEIVIIS